MNAFELKQVHLNLKNIYPKKKSESQRSSNSVSVELYRQQTENRYLGKCFAVLKEMRKKAVISSANCKTIF